MGLKPGFTRHTTDVSGPQRDLRRQRFGSYFPRLFAYVQSAVDNEDRAGAIAADVFVRAFSRTRPLAESEDEFRLVLFGLAHDLCEPRKGAAGRAEASLNAREREVISLLFDAQLTRREVGRLLGVQDGAVAGALFGGLKKLKASLLPAPAAPSFLRLS